MWVWFSVCSALLLGLYDVAKKQALKRNGVLVVLFFATALSTVFLIPFFATSYRPRSRAERTENQTHIRGSKIGKNS